MNVSLVVGGMNIFLIHLGNSELGVSDVGLQYMGLLSWSWSRSDYWFCFGVGLIDRLKSSIAYSLMLTSLL